LGRARAFRPRGCGSAVRAHHAPPIARIHSIQQRRYVFVTGRTRRLALPIIAYWFGPGRSSSLAGAATPGVCGPEAQFQAAQGISACGARQIRAGACAFDCLYIFLSGRYLAKRMRTGRSELESVDAQLRVRQVPARRCRSGGFLRKVRPQYRGRRRLSVRGSRQERPGDWHSTAFRSRRGHRRCRGERCRRCGAPTWFRLALRCRCRARVQPVPLPLSAARCFADASGLQSSRNAQVPTSALTAQSRPVPDRFCHCRLLSVLLRGLGLRGRHCRGVVGVRLADGAENCRKTKHSAVPLLAGRLCCRDAMRGGMPAGRALLYRHSRHPARWLPARCAGFRCEGWRLSSHASHRRPVSWVFSSAEIHRHEEFGVGLGLFEPAS